MAHDKLGTRMKEFYENRSKTFLVRRTPVIIRLDGKAFHTFTRGFERPCDRILHEAMEATMRYLCENIQGCKIGYTQSDEITLLLTDWETLETNAWFEYNVQKICSIAASMATLAFNKELARLVMEEEKSWNHGLTPQSLEIQMEHSRYISNLKNAVAKGALFDARAFNIPKEEVVNCFIWRQQDAIRNAIQMLGQTYFSHKELQGKNCAEILDMLMSQKRIYINNMPATFQRGCCCFKIGYPHVSVDPKTQEEVVTHRTKWTIDEEIPVFTEDRSYIGRYVDEYED